MAGSVTFSNLLSFKEKMLWYSNFLSESRLMSDTSLIFLGFLVLSEIKVLMYPLLGWIVEPT